MRRFVLLVALLLVAGCSNQAAPSALPTTPAPPAPSAPPTAPAPAVQPAPSAPQVLPASVVKDSTMTATLRSATGAEAQVYLYAPDEQVSVATDPSCMAETDDTVRTGHYSFYLGAAGENPTIQPVAPFTDTRFSFNDQRRNYIQVLPRSASGQADLLAIRQYGSCNGNSLAVLAPSPDGKSLVQYRFASADGKFANTTGTKAVKTLQPGMIETSIYVNTTGQWTTTDWQVDDQEAVLKAVKTEVTSMP